MQASYNAHAPSTKLLTNSSVIVTHLLGIISSIIDTKCVEDYVVRVFGEEGEARALRSACSDLTSWVGAKLAALRA